MFGQTITTRPPGLQTRSISASPASPPLPGLGVNAEHATTTIGPVVRQRQIIEEASGHPHSVAVLGPLELARQDLAERPRGLDRNDFTGTTNELERKPAGARTHLDHPIDIGREPPDHGAVEPLSAGEPIVELWLEAVQELPGKGYVNLGVAGSALEEPPRLSRI